MRTHTITTSRPAVLLSLLALGALGLLVVAGGGRSAAATPPATGSQAITTVETTITKHPGNHLRKKVATFEFTANQPGATFECALRIERGSRAHPRPDLVRPFSPCTSPLRVSTGRGKHELRVRATVGGVTDATPARAVWGNIRGG
jgi:hypothetical protein